MAPAHEKFQLQDQLYHFPSLSMFPLIVPYTDPAA